jgi:hypothetical protein
MNYCIDDIRAIVKLAISVVAGLLAVWKTATPPRPRGPDGVNHVFPSPVNWQNEKGPGYFFSGKILLISSTILSMSASLRSPFLKAWLTLTLRRLYSTTVTSASLAML